MTALKKLRISFSKLTASNFKPLFTAYVRPYLEHCLYRQCDRIMKKGYRCLRESAAKRCIISSEDRFRVFKLINMEDKLRHGDLIETFKILTGKTNVSPGQFFIWKEAA